MLLKTPPMGFNTWNTFGGNISDSLVRETADAMADLGYRDAGYRYIVIDDCWSERQRDAEHRLVPSQEKFPQGMKDLADYLHAKRFLFGMYSCAGVRTCANYPGSYDHEFLDARTFAEWGVDYLKYDYCFKPETSDGATLYRRMAMALRESGRDIVFSACSWGSEDCWRWMRGAGADLYRSTGDILDNFTSFRDIALGQWDKLGYNAIGCFNDLDMLICGMYGKGNVALGGCTDEEYRTHFALWCFFGVPLMIGCDVRNATPATHDLLTNRGLIALDQDPECRPPFLVTKWDEDRYVFARFLEGGEMALGFFNFSDKVNGLFCPFCDIGLPVTTGYGMRLTDVMTGEDMGLHREYFEPRLESHACAVYRARLERL